MFGLSCLLLVCVMAICLFLTASGSLSHAAPQAGPAPWKPEIGDHHAVPGRLIAVDKASQKLSLLERHSPLAQTRQFICTTGRMSGDKSVEGDLKTPEGVYFIVQHINSGLDFIKYGREAFTLNYPNPVDRLRQKTGYGIWIHGRGEPIVPMQTEGCVAMINDDLAGIGKILVPGTPVALTDSFSVKSGPVSKENAETVRILEKQVKEWAGAWASRSGDFFSFYDKDAYSQAQGEPFSLFRAQKQRLFKMLPWIKIEVSNIHVLEGPGYWVTWFQQDYSAPNLTSKGVRRLYWHKDKEGAFKILGMEWVPGLSTGTLVASAEPAVPPLEASPRTEEQNAAAKEKNPAAASITAAGTAILVASSEKLAPVSTLDHIEDPSMGPQPEPLLAPYLLMLNPDDSTVPQGEWTGNMPRPGQDEAKNTAQTASKSGADKKTPAKQPEKAEKPAAPAAAEPAKLQAAANKPIQTAAASPASTTPAAVTDDSIKTMMDTLDKALKAAAAVPAPTPVARTGSPESSQPAKTNAPRAAEEKTPSAVASASPEDKKAAGTAPEVQATGQQSAPSLQSEAGKPAAPVSGSQPAGNLAEAGTKDKAEDPAADERVNITFGQEGGQSGAPSPTAEETGHQDIAATVMDITSRIKEWGESWEAADLEGYISFYAPNAVQGNRRGTKSIQVQKENLWKRNKPTAVNLNDIQVSLSGDSATVRMIQEYSSRSGHSDTGYKTLELKKINGVWLITREDWKAQPNG